MSGEPPVAVLEPCDGVPELAGDVIGDNVGGQSVDPIFDGVVVAYINEHSDTYAGRWIDRDAGGTFVVAFTDDPETHRTALARRRP
jgi:hypothetical protein